MLLAAHGQGKSLKNIRVRVCGMHGWGCPGVMKINLLSYVPYSKKEAIEELSRVFGWEYYGGKHFESRFTKYFQSVYPPKNLAAISVARI